MLSLKGKHILVTGGGGSGVGHGVCEAVTQADASVIIHVREHGDVGAAKERFPRARFVHGDLSLPHTCEAIFAELDADGIHLDGLVNNAGIGLSKPAHEVSEEEWSTLTGIDVMAVWRLSKLFVTRALAAQRSGNIVNISSVHAHSTMPRYAVYAGAKGNVEAFSRGMAVEYGSRGIRVNAISPGYVHSDQNYALISTWSDDPAAWVSRHSRNQQCIAQEIAPIDCGYLAAFLLSDLSRFITGQTIRIDAGMTAMLYNNDFV